MTIRFVDNGTTVDFLADEVEVTEETDLSEHEDLDGNLEHDVRRSRLIFIVRGIPEETTSTDTTWADIWDSANQGNTVTFDMDKDDASISAVEVLPDPSQVPAFARYRKGSEEKGRVFGFKSTAAYAPGNATLTQYTSHSTPL